MSESKTIRDAQRAIVRYAIKVLDISNSEMKTRMLMKNANPSPFEKALRDEIERFCFFSDDDNL